MIELVKKYIQSFDYLNDSEKELFFKFLHNQLNILFLEGVFDTKPFDEDESNIKNWCTDQWNCWVIFYRPLQKIIIQNEVEKLNNTKK